MAYVATQHRKCSHEYLRKNARAVIDLVNATAPYWDRVTRQPNYWELTGPDGIPYEIAIRPETEGQWGYWDVLIDEYNDGSIHLWVSSGVIGNMRRSLSVAPWVIDAFACSSTVATYQLIAQLAFGQLPVSVAASLCKLSTANIGSELYGKGSTLSHLLRSSVTKAKFRPESTLIDPRGMLAWMLLTNQEKAEPVVAVE
ncbi:hypothetical protein [Candidatus Aalborgicola defluviihabitans]|uniref:hypothetical protein n=1 Tax=Candidatus Aalborgicola defluviihabitans TaxID=3386187 RepID=UPI001D648566|nr:hypothetical protein [Burkholderiales bacterium]MBK7281447.1 hypothetical protein [Burkholderiales bacterium]MBK7314021.1 hypothetical protein [Burkholderiales bacterium]